MLRAAQLSKRLVLARLLVYLGLQIWVWGHRGLLLKRPWAEYKAIYRLFRVVLRHPLLEVSRKPDIGESTRNYPGSFSYHRDWALRECPVDYFGVSGFLDLRLDSTALFARTTHIGCARTTMLMIQSDPGNNNNRGQSKHKKTSKENYNPSLELHLTQRLYKN